MVENMTNLEILKQARENPEHILCLFTKDNFKVAKAFWGNMENKEIRELKKDLKEIEEKKKCKHKWIDTSWYMPEDGGTGWSGGMIPEERCKKCDIDREGGCQDSIEEINEWEKMVKRDLRDEKKEFWQNHLQKMVRKKEPLKYIEKFLK